MEKEREILDPFFDENFINIFQYIYIHVKKFFTFNDAFNDETFNI